MKYIYTSILVLFCTEMLFSFNRESISNQYGFIENKGQVVNEYFQENTNVKFIASKNNLQLILLDNAISYQINQISHAEMSSQNISGCDFFEDYVKLHRVDIEFVNYSNVISIEPIEKSEDYINYYNLKNSNQELITCNHFKAVKYRNVYKNIDFIFYSDISSNTFKYDIVLHPGSNINDIKLHFKGQSGLKLEGSNLIIQTSIGEIKEFIPKSYYSEGREVKVSYKLEGNILSFIGDFNPSQTLTIDPLLNYATYFGSSTNDVSLELCNDFDDNTILTGFTNSVSNIATTGAYQTEMKGDNDAFLVKFSASGSRLWATYYGGTRYDTGHGVATDAFGNIVMVGWTKSTSNIATTGSHQFFHSGGEFDSYIVKFSSSGIRYWASYYGGQQDDYINDIVIDGYTDIIFTGRTSSLVNIASSKSFQEKLGGGNDGFLAKFSTSGVRKWGTYIGGAGFDVSMEVATDIFNNIAITGYTQSADSIASPNGFKKSISGVWDAFLTKFGRDGNRLWSTYYGGSKEDNGRGIDFDGNGNIYITGNTFSKDSIATFGTHQDTISSVESDVIVTKFGSGGNLIWSSYYGGEFEDFGNVASISPWNQIVIAGNTLSSNGIATVNAYKTTISGQSDVFICSFFENGLLDFGTYYGGSLNDYAHGITFDKKGRIICTGYTGSSDGISTNDAYQTDIEGENDAFYARFSDALITDSVFIQSISGIWCGDNSIRIPYSVDGDFSENNIFTVQLSNAAGHFSEFYNIGQIASNVSGTITAIIPKQVVSSDNYRVRIISSEPKVISPDNGIDITLYELPNPKLTGEKAVCSNKQYFYKSNQAANISYKWEASNGRITGSAIKDTCYVIWDSIGTGNIKLIQTNSQTGCKDSNITQVAIYPEVQASTITGENEVCPNADILYYTSSNEFLKNEWRVINGVVLDYIGKDSVLIKWEENTYGQIKLIQSSIQSNCVDSTILTVNLFTLPKPNFIGDFIVDVNKKYSYKTQPNSRQSIVWEVTGGELIGDSSNSLIEVLWQNPGTGFLKLILTDKDSGCKDSLIQNIKVKYSASELITGDTLVCTFSTYNYSFHDSLYSLTWIAIGGVIKDSDTLNEIDVFWELSGIGSLKLIRKHKLTFEIDTLILKIKILNSPDGKLLGINNACENSTNYFFTDAHSKFKRKWICSNCSIIGEDFKDSVLVFWDEIVNQPDTSFENATLELMLEDTLNGCIRNLQRKIKIFKKPESEIIGDSLVCSNLIYSYSTFKENGSQTSWTIEGGVITNNIGDTTIVIQWQSHDLGKLSLIEINSSGCADTISLKINIKETPEQPMITQKGKELFSSSEMGNQWFLDDVEIPEAKNQRYTPTKTGYFSVQITGVEGCKSERSKPFYFDVNSVIEFTNNNITIYPNPTNEFVILKINADIYNDINLQIVNIIGKKLFDERIIFKSNEMKIDLSNYSSGVYFIILNYDKDKIFYKRVVKL